MKQTKAFADLTRDIFEHKNSFEHYDCYTVILLSKGKTLQLLIAIVLNQEGRLKLLTKFRIIVPFHIKLTIDVSLITE